MRMRGLAVGVAALVFPMFSVLPDAEAGGWERLGPETGLVLSLAAAPSRPRTIYAGLLNGRVFRSEDGGETWTPASHGIGRWDTAYDPAVTPQDPNGVYILSNSRLHKSTDGGRNWRKLDVMPNDGPVRVFLIHPKEPGVLYAASPYNVPMRRSRDGGATWEEIPGAPHTVSALAIDPTDPNVLYAGRGNGRANGIFKSTDGGNTWKEITQGLEPRCDVETILLDPLSPRTLWLVSRTDSPEKRFWKSTDAGASWAPVEHTLGKAQFWLLAAEPREGRTILYGQVHANQRLYRSDDGGVSWLEIDPGPPGSSWVESVLPLPDGELLAATRRGVLRSRDRGASWTPSNRGLTGNAILGLALDPRRPWLYASVDGVGVFKSENGGASWNALSIPPKDGPWGVVAIHPQKPDTVYLGFFQHLARSDDAGKNWTVYDVPCGDPQMLVTDPALPTGLYGTAELNTCTWTPCIVSKSVDEGKTWTCVFQIARERVKLLAADPVRPLTVYVQKDGDLYRSEDAGFSWDLLAKGLQAFTLAFAPTPSGPIYAGVQGDVLRSLDQGKSWLRSDSGLPPGDPVIGIVLDPKAPSTLYAATRYKGIFKSADAGVTWKLHAPVPPDVSVDRLVIDPRDRALYVGTGAGGVMRWRQGESI